MSDCLLFTATPAWQAAYPGAVSGVLAMRGVANPDAHPALDAARQRLEATLRARYAGMGRADLRASGPLSAYDAYYRRFGQTYHVLQQLESVALKGKPIPRRGAVVEAMFMAELDGQLLTAGHDLDALVLPVTIDVATGAGRYVLSNGAEQACKPGDMVIRDAHGILSSVILGPARQARLTAQTHAALFAVYAPAGIGEAAVRAHLAAIEANVRLISDEAATVGLVTIVAGG